MSPSPHQYGCALSHTVLTTFWNFGKFAYFLSCFREIASVLSQPSLIDLLKVKEIIAMCNTPFLSSILWHLQNVFSRCPLPYTNIRGEKISTPTSLHAAHRCSAVHDVGTGSLLSRAFTWHLPCSARRLCCAPCRMKPIVPGVLLLKPEDASAITIDFLWRLTKTERMSPSILILFLPCG